MTDEAKKKEVLEETKEEILDAEEVKEETAEKVLSPEEEIGKLKVEIEDWKQSYLRKQADFQNFTKRKEKEIEELRQYSSQKDRKSTRLNSSHANISYAVFCLK